MSPVEHKLSLGYEDTVDLILPDGREVSILLGYQDPENQLPELDILLPATMAANCFGTGFIPAPENGEDTPHIRLACQIIIPLSPK